MRGNGRGDGGPAGADPAGGDPASVGNKLDGVVHGSAVQAGRISGGVHFTVVHPDTAPRPIPAQLPPSPPNFTGRRYQLRTLQHMAAAPAPGPGLRIVVLSGPGGAGKTALASHWLHSISDHYDGGALYANLRGHQQTEAASPDDVLARFIPALGVPAGQIPPGLDEQAGLYRSVTAGRRMLVLLDDAVSAAQVRPLIPGPGPSTPPGPDRGKPEGERPSLMVVTTRWRLTGLSLDGAAFIEVGTLGEKAAMELLAQIVGTGRAAGEPDAVREVVQLCAGLPLALCVAGARLAARPHWNVSRVAGELAREQDRLAALHIPGETSIRAAFDLSYRALPAEQAGMYRLASVLPGPDFSADLAASATQTDPRQALELLDALVDASLLESHGDRFGFHDLVRLHAREQATSVDAAEFRAVTARAVDWYLHRAIAADYVVIPGRWRLNSAYEQARTDGPAYPDSTAALDWLEGELPALLASIQSARQYGWHDRVWQLCEALAGLFGYRKHFRSWVSSHLMGAESARDAGNRPAEARMRTQLGLAYRQLGRYRDAQEQLNTALALDRREGHRLGEATDLEQLGLIDLARGRPEPAVAAFGRAREIFREVGRERGTAMMTCRLGEAHRDAGRFDEAVRHLTDARRLFADLPDRYNEARANADLGQAYLSAGRPAEALPVLDEACAVMGQLGSPYQQARIQMSLAEASERLGDRQRARDHAEQALLIYDGLRAPDAAEARRRLSRLPPR